MGFNSGFKGLIILYLWLSVINVGGNYQLVSTYTTSTSATTGRHAQIGRSDIAAKHRSTLNVPDRC